MRDGPLPPIILRDYQQTAVDEIRESFKTFRRVCYVLPTGGGKTCTFTYVVANAHTKGKRVTIVAHRQEIVGQISQSLTRMGVEHGIIAPGFKMTTLPVQVAMVQTLCRRLFMVPACDLLVIDECHHAVAGSWEKVTKEWSNARILGVTATPERLDGRGLGNAFDDMIIGPSMANLIERGDLAPYTYLAPPSEIDLSGVTCRGGDYDPEELEDAVQSSKVVGDAVDHYKRHLDGRPALAFCATVRGAKAVAYRFTQAGIPAASVDGEMAPGERARRLNGLANGELMVVTSCELISEGFDVPAVSGAILLRPTMSLAVFLQQIGRSLRPKADGGTAIILDHVGNVHTHGMPDMEREWTLDGLKHGPSNVSTCQKCYVTLPKHKVYSPNFECPIGLGERRPDPPGAEPAIVAKREAVRAERAEKHGYTRGRDECHWLEDRDHAGGKRDPGEIDGELEEVTNIRPPNFPEWAGGLSLLVHGKLWFLLLERAGSDLGRLEEIRLARGYKRGWIKHVLAARFDIEMELHQWIHGERDFEKLSIGALWAAIRHLQEKNDDAQTAPMIRTIRAEINKRKSRAA